MVRWRFSMGVQRILYASKCCVWCYMTCFCKSLHFVGYFPMPSICCFDLISSAHYCTAMGSLQPLPYCPPQSMRQLDFAYMVRGTMELPMLQRWCCFCCSSWSGSMHPLSCLHIGIVHQKHWRIFTRHHKPFYQPARVICLLKKNITQHHRGATPWTSQLVLCRYISPHQGPVLIKWIYQMCQKCGHIWCI